MKGSREMYYPQFDMGPPPEPFFSWAGGRKRSRVQMISFLGLHTITPHELSEGHGGRQMTSRLTSFKISQRAKIPLLQKSPVLFSEIVKIPIYLKVVLRQIKSWTLEPDWGRPLGRKWLLTTLENRSWRLLQTDCMLIKNKVSYKTEAKTKAFIDI